MKKSIIFISFLFVVAGMYSQNKLQGRVYYKASSIPIDLNFDSSKKKLSKETRKMVSDIFKSATDVIGVLEFSNDETLYKLDAEMKNDGASLINITKIRAGNEHHYYGNATSKEYFYQSDVTGEMLLIEMLPKKWKLTQETKKIGGYICYKAIDIESENKKQKPIAWFAPEIPVNSGPKEYIGLPGLILEVQEYGFLFTATKIELNPTKKVLIKKPTKGKKTTYKEYKEMTMSFRRMLRKN